MSTRAGNRGGSSIPFSLVVVWLGVGMLLHAQADARGAGQCRDQIVAVVGGRAICMEDLQRRWQSSDPGSFSRVQQQRYAGEKRALDGLVADALISEAAAKRSLTAEQLKAEIQSSGEPPSDGEIRDVYDRSAGSTGGLTFEQAAPVIAVYLRQQKGNEALQRFVEELRRASPPDLRVKLEPPRQQIEVSSGDPTSGPDSAKVDIVEFSDFECPYCRQAAPVLNRLLSRFRGQVRLVWKDYPLPIHVSARISAEAARCAADHGRFWEYHDMLFDHQQALSSADLRKYASSLGLDARTFASCLDGGVHRARVAASIEEAKRLGVTATPTVFINGRMIAGAVPFETYEQVILEELASPASDACSAEACPLGEGRRNEAR